MYVEVPPAPPPRPKTRHYHDGFYARLSVGAASMVVESTIEDFDGNVQYSGEGLAFDIFFGGTPAAGLVIGGGALLQDAFEPEVTVESGDETVFSSVARDETLGLFIVGPMIDGFPDPDGGFHVGGLLGPAQIGVQDNNENNSSGFGAAIWVGYAWWISSDWSLGGVLRLAGATTRREFPAPVGDVTDTTRAGALMFTALYH